MSRVLINMLGGDPDRLSGIAVYALRQVEALLRRNVHDYVLLSSWPRHRLAEHLPLNNLQFVAGRSDRSEKLQYLIGAWQVAQVARREAIDCVFTPWPLAPIAGGKKRILVVHDLYRMTHPELHNWHMRLGWNLMFPLSVRASQTIVSVSEATASAFRTYYPRYADRVEVVHEAPALRALARPDPPFPRPYLLTVSTPAATKNLPRLIAALDQLRQRGQRLTLCWIGSDDGSVAEALRHHPSLTEFHRIGRVDEETLATYYAHAEAYICPSLAEGFCLPVVEAQSHGVPVICSDLPVLREVAGSGASYFDPEDISAIAETIGTVMGQPKLRLTLGEAARINVRRFSWDRSAARLETLFTV